MLFFCSCSGIQKSLLQQEERKHFKVKAPWERTFDAIGEVYEFTARSKVFIQATGDQRAVDQWAVGCHANNRIKSELFGAMIVPVKHICFITPVKWPSMGIGKLDNRVIGIVYGGGKINWQIAPAKSIDMIFQHSSVVRSQQNLTRQSGAGGSRLCDDPDAFRHPFS